MATTEDKDGAKGKVVRKPPRFKRHLEEADIVGPRGVPKILKDLSSVKFSGDNKKNLRNLLTTYATWGRTIGPAFEFEEFVIKLEKFSGTRSVRNMVEALRRGEEYVYSSGKPNNTNNTNNDEDFPNPDDFNNADDFNTNTNTNTNTNNNNNNNNNDNFDDIDLDEVMEFEKTAKTLLPEDLERMENNRLQALQRRQQSAGDATAPKAGGFFSSKFAALATKSGSDSNKNDSDVPASNESEVLVDNTDKDSSTHTDPSDPVDTPSSPPSNESENALPQSNESSILVDNLPSSKDSEVLDNSSNDSEPASNEIVPDR